MSGRSKPGLFRQFSLQTEGTGRPSLKKQLSSEQINSETGVRCKDEDKNTDRPRLVRIAWGENRQLSTDQTLLRTKKYPETVEVKKCVEYRRPATAKLRTQKSIDRDSILYTRQELAERLRKAWIDREQNKQNIDIFLTHTDQEKYENNLESDTISEPGKMKGNKETEVELDKPRKPIHDDSSYKIEMPKAQNKPKKDLQSEFTYVPSNTTSKSRDVNINLSVTMPDLRNDGNQNKENNIDDNAKHNRDEEDHSKVESQEIETKISKLVKQTSINVETEPRQNTDKPKPASATTRREVFQKRTNTAFNGSLSLGKNHKPPLVRTLSVPVKHEPTKPVFLAAKRRLKTVRRKERDNNEISDEDVEDDTVKVKKKEGRCKSAPGSSGEIVPMVSLVSPAGSDAEEVAEKKPEPKSKSATPEKPILVGNGEPIKTYSLRKTVKQVSFQQSTIHAIRSFSASFPSRRSSMASVAKCPQPIIVDREKRAPLESPAVETRVAKRRHIFTDKKMTSNSLEELTNDELSKTDPVPNLTIISSSDADTEISTKNKEEISSADKGKTNSTKVEINLQDVESEETDVETDSETPKFETPKEQECWTMYKKMSDKGLPVSYDTILRGMLTPTEYRLTRKEIVTPVP